MVAGHPRNRQVVAEGGSHGGVVGGAAAEPGPVGGRQRQGLERDADAHGQMASSSPVAPTSLGPSRSAATVAQAAQAAPASRSSSAWTRSGRPALANTWLLRVLQEAPAVRPWLTMTSTAPRAWSRWAARRRRQAAIAGDGGAAGTTRVAWWSGLWMTTSWTRPSAPTSKAVLWRRSAGRRTPGTLGTTRTRQPEPVGLGARRRSARTSGGVMCSLPGQKGAPERARRCERSQGHTRPGRPARRDRHPAAAERVLAQLTGRVGQRRRWQDAGRGPAA